MFSFIFVFYFVHLKPINIEIPLLHLHHWTVIKQKLIFKTKTQRGSDVITFVLYNLIKRSRDIVLIFLI